MTYMSDLQDLRSRVERVEKRVGEDRSMTERHEEQISGEGGVRSALKKIDDDVASLKRTVWTVGGGIFVAMVSFTISTLTVFQ